ncbi:hypothetical protein QBC40DRAFT_270162 [Triangularia verruculosa]|uniref:Uncharacterized protein n=1 Tax=Triangularia verruculosa TaxID=2587418 RepID=A0AAN6X5D0_9PEZI|nr:hypothetical protein QBC40DRAFT_270162 [Triangularia verruculosa]
MAPAKRTSLHLQSSASKDQKKKKNTTAAQTTAIPAESPHNSITVAHRTMPPHGPRARSSSVSSKVGTSSLSSSHSSPPPLAAIKEKVMPPSPTNEVEMKSPTSSKTVLVPSSPSPKNNGVSMNNANATSNDIPQVPQLQTKSTLIAPKRQPAVHPAYSYEFCTNIDEITMHQLEEDIIAYHNDMAFVQAQLADETLTPQESRTFQLRLLDLGHQIRHCRHRIELIQFQNRKPTKPANLSRLTYANTATPLGPANTINGTSSFAAKQRPDSFVSSTPMSGKRPAEEDEDEEMTDGPSKRAKQSPSPGTAAAHVSHYDLSTIEIVDTGEEGDTPGVNTLLQRLGFWKCRLCCSTKYLLAGSGRSPAAPCKWPLKDISKMITHFTEMHSEHTVSERCYELGAALAKNRGPFEYWLRRTRNQNLGDGKCLDEAIFKLVNGQMPALLRLHSRAAAGVVTD